MMADGVFLIDPDRFERIAFILTGKGTHGIYPSRDGKLLYVSNRGSNKVTGGPHGPGSVTVVDPATRHILATWLTHRIKVGHGPHGMTVWPQPGRYSLGHTGNMR